MSFAGNALTAKLVLSADASRVVGAAVQTKDALKGVADQARDTGKAGAEMGAGVATGTTALTAMTREQALVARGLQATGDARKGELALLTQQAQKAGVVTSSIAAMSAAHQSYNNTITQAAALRDAGLITEGRYKDAVSAAGTALSLAAAEATQLGADSAKAAGDIAALEQLVSKLAGTAGVSGGQIRNLRGALRALPEVVAAYPVTATFIGIAAAVGVAVAANQYYDSSVRQITVAAAAQGNVLGLQRRQYLDLADQIASLDHISQSAARSVAGVLIANNVSPKAFLDAANAAAGYARVIGTDVPQAQQQLTKAIVSQDAFEQLNAQYGLVSDSEAQFIRQLDASGDHLRAGEERAKVLKERFAELKDQVGLVKGAFEDVGTTASNLFAELGKATLKLPSALLAIAALKNGGIEGYLAALDSLNEDTDKRDAGPVSKQDPAVARRNQESIDVGNILRQNNPFPSQLAANAADRATILKAQKDGAIDAATATAALNAVDTKRQEILKAQRDAYLNLNETLKEHLDRIKQLISSGPQVLAGAKAQADASAALANVAGGSTLAQQKLNDAFEIQKGTLPYVTALTWAHGASAQKLKDIIAGLTAEMTRNQQANHYADTVNDIQSRLGNLGQTSSLGMINAALALNVQKLDDWKATSLANLDSTKAGYRSFVDQVHEIYDSELAQIYEDDLARRHDWASGTELALIDMKRSQEDWASTSRNLTQATGQEFEDDFVNVVVSQKDPLSSFFNWYIEQLARVIYQQKLAGSFNSVAGGLTNFVGQALGTGGGSKVGVVSASEGGTDFLSGIGQYADLSAIQLHGGGSVRGASVTRNVDPTVTGNLPRFHRGTAPGLNVGETLAVLRDDEYVDTAEQRQARLRAVQQPQVYMLPGQSGGQSAAPNVSINFINQSGTALSANKGPLQKSGNGWSMDVFIDQLDQGLAAKSASGNSAYTNSLEQTHKIERQPS